MSKANKPVSHLQDTGHSWLEPKTPEPPATYQEFPKRVFHPSTPGGTVVASKEEQDALGSEWVESPADLTAETAAAAAKLAQEQADVSAAAARAKK